MDSRSVEQAQSTSDAEQIWLDLRSTRSRRPVVDGVPSYWLTLGVSTASFALLTTFADFEALDTRLRLALWCFVVAIPAGLAAHLIHRASLNIWFSNVQSTASAIANLAAMVGITSYVSHFGVVAPILFVSATVASLVVANLVLESHSAKQDEIEALELALMRGDSSDLEGWLWPHRPFGIDDDDYLIEYVDDWDVRFDGLKFEPVANRAGWTVGYRLDWSHCSRLRQLLMSFSLSWRPKATSPRKLRKLVRRYSGTPRRTVR